MSLEFGDDLYYEKLLDPPKFTKKKFVLMVVKVYDTDGNEIRHHVRDFGKRTSQEWLTSLTMWAMCSGYRIELIRKVK